MAAARHTSASARPWPRAEAALGGGGEWAAVGDGDGEPGVGEGEGEEAGGASAIVVDGGVSPPVVVVVVTPLTVVVVVLDDAPPQGTIFPPMTQEPAGTAGGGRSRRTGRHRRCWRGARAELWEWCLQGGTGNCSNCQRRRRVGGAPSPITVTSNAGGDESYWHDTLMAKAISTQQRRDRRAIMFISDCSSVVERDEW